MKAIAAAVTAAHFLGGAGVVALRGPPGETRLEGGIGDVVGPHGAGDQLYVVDQALAALQKPDLHEVDRTRTVVQNAGGLDVGPGRLAGLVAVGPVRRESVVTAGIDQLEAASASARILTPSAACPIGHLVHHDVNRIGHHHAQVVGADLLVGHRDRHPLPAVR